MEILGRAGPYIKTLRKIPGSQGEGQKIYFKVAQRKSISHQDAKAGHPPGCEPKHFMFATGEGPLGVVTGIVG